MCCKRRLWRSLEWGINRSRASFAGEESYRRRAEKTEEHELQIGQVLLTRQAIELTVSVHRSLLETENVRERHNPGKDLGHGAQRAKVEILERTFEMKISFYGGVRRQCFTTSGRENAAEECSIGEILADQE